METKNAVIEYTSLGPESHGIFSAYIGLHYGDSGQSFGGYSLDQHNGKRSGDSERIGTAYGMEFIRRTMKAVGVEKWEDLKGKHIRVKADHSKVHAIGHIINENWFTPETDLKSFIS